MTELDLWEITKWQYLLKTICEESTKSWRHMDEVWGTSDQRVRMVV